VDTFICPWIDGVPPWGGQAAQEQRQVGAAARRWAGRVAAVAAQLGAADFYQRIKTRRGHSIAIVASARKLACLFWCLLTRGEDYAFAQPSLTKKKMRRLELQAGAPRLQGGHGIWSTNDAMREAERELALQAQRAYERTIKDRQHTTGASATPGRASNGAFKEHVTRQTPKAQSALWHVVARAHPHSPTTGGHRSTGLDFHPSPVAAAAGDVVDTPAMESSGHWRWLERGVEAGARFQAIQYRRVRVPFGASPASSSTPPARSIAIADAMLLSSHVTSTASTPTARDDECLAEDFAGVATTPVFRADTKSDVAAKVPEERVQLVTNRDPTDEIRA
jgi:hypothetical protein